MVGHWNGLPRYALPLLIVISLSLGLPKPTGAESNKPPTAYINDISPFPAEANASLDFVGTGLDTDGSVVMYEWDFDGDGEYDWNSSDTGETKFTYTVPDTYEIRFRVLDNNGNWSEVVTSSVLVTPDTQSNGQFQEPESDDDGALLTSAQTVILLGVIGLVVVLGVTRTILVQRKARIVIPPGAQTTPDHFQCAVCGVDTIPGERTCTICGAIHPKVWSPAKTKPQAADVKKSKADKPRKLTRRQARSKARAKAELAVDQEAPLKYIVEEIFQIHHDGRVMNHIGQVDSGTDYDLVGGMFSAIMDFVKDSFGRPGYMGAIEYGDNKILIEMGRHSFLAAVVYGEAPRKFREQVTEALARTETYLSGVIESWTGDRELMIPAREFLAPLVMETAGVTRLEVAKALAGEGVKLTSAWEYYQGCIRLKVACVNHTNTVITDLKVDVDYDRHLLRWDHHEPKFDQEGSVIHMGIVEGGGKKTVAVAFDPLMCQKTSLNALASFKDARGELNTTTMKRRVVEVVCPLFFTPENASTAILQRLVEDKLDYKDSKVFTIPERLKPVKALEQAKQTLEGRDVKFVKQYIQPEPFKAEAWYYGVTKVKQDEMVIRVGIDQESGLISLFAAAKQSASLVGLLAELGHDLIKLAARKGVILKAVNDQLVKDELLAASYLLEDSLKEAAVREAEAAKKHDEGAVTGKDESDREVEDASPDAEIETEPEPAAEPELEPEPTEIILPSGRRSFDPAKLAKVMEALESRDGTPFTEADLEPDEKSKDNRAKAKRSMNGGKKGASKSG